VPTEPIPVHTAYAVPSGRLRVATPTRPKLNTIMIAVATDGHKRVNPSEYFSPIENPVSNTPAITRIAQAYCLIIFPRLSILGLGELLTAHPLCLRTVLRRPQSASYRIGQRCRWPV